MIFDSEKAIGDISVNIVSKILEQCRLEVNQELEQTNIKDSIENNEKKKIEMDSKIWNEFEK